MPKISRNLQIDDSSLLRLMKSIANSDVSLTHILIHSSPALSLQSLSAGATRKTAPFFYLERIGHYLNAGDTALHVAAAGYCREIAEVLVNKGADVGARNRRGAEPLHYAANGNPRSHRWNPNAQAETIRFLISAGANANALNKDGVAPLHRAVRTRCAAAVDALIRNGANVRLGNNRGLTPLHLAVQNTGRGGSSSPESKNQQIQIIELLLKAGASPKDRDGLGKTVLQSANKWLISLLQ
jgi:ankyrin repeat protein